ncbi:MAG: rRNA pseudouridine synthase [Spirochaetaceae bacterium]|nr:rRNA pseudouridine synthase [Spirochaetaceae bacterium]
MKTERIDKVLAKHGFGTRKEVKKLLHLGLVTVNGIVVTAQDFKIDIDQDSLAVEDEIINLRTNLYIMMNKCQDVVCSSKDGLHRTVFDLLKEEDNHSFMGGDLHCVGRLDIDTEGLLLLTTDGSLTHKLISPKSEISKTYFIKLRDSVSLENQHKYIDSCKNGIDVPPEGNESGFFSLPAILKFDSDNSCFLTITEGKYHQVKRMIFALGNEVIYLKRTAIGGLKLDEKLNLGEYRELTQEEITEIFS